MDTEEPATPQTRTSSFSAEGILGTGITIGSIGVLFLLLGLAQAMRDVEGASWILLAIGAVLVVSGGVTAAFGRRGKSEE